MKRLPVVAFSVLSAQTNGIKCVVANGTPRAILSAAIQPANSSCDRTLVRRLERLPEDVPAMRSITSHPFIREGLTGRKT